MLSEQEANRPRAMMARAPVRALRISVFVIMRQPFQGVNGIDPYKLQAIRPARMGHSALYGMIFRRRAEPVSHAQGRLGEGDFAQPTQR